MSELVTGGAVDAPADAELVRRAREGDLVSFGQLVSRHQASALRVATLTLGSATDADDVAQEAFIKAYNALGRFDVDRRFEPWLYRLVANTAKNRLRRAGRQAALALRAVDELPSTPLAPDELAVRSDEQQSLLAAINRLRADDRLVLHYRWFEQFSEAEIARALGCRRGTVKSKLSRAMARLRDELEEL